MVLSIFDILDGFIYLGGTNGPPPKIQWPLVAQKVLNISNYNLEDHVTSPYNKE